jgi:hypothetical protein
MVAPSSVANASTPITFNLTGPYLTASAAWIAGFRKWPLVVMTAIAGRESGWTNAPPHTDNNGVTVTGLWQIQPNGLQAPVSNAQQAFAKAGGNTLAGLQNWALTPPGQTSLGGVNQPNPYPWGTVPPAADAGYYQNGTFVPHNYNLTAAKIAQALYAYAQVMAFGPATQSELNSSNGWGTTGLTATATQVSADDTSPDDSGSQTGGGCSAIDPKTGKPGVVFSINLKIASLTLNKCQGKAILGGVLTALGGGVLLLGGALIVVSGLAGKGPLAPVVNVAQGYVAGAKKLPGVGRASPAAPSGPSESQTMRHDRAVIKRERDKRSVSDTIPINRKAGAARRDPLRPGPGEEGYAEDAA